MEKESNIKDQLTYSIIKYIYLNMGINSDSINSIKNNKFLIDEKIDFLNENDEGEKYSDTASVWTCKTTISNIELEIMYSELDCYQFLLIKLQNSPTYGCVLYNNSSFDIKFNNKDYNICCELSDGKWITAPIYLQATFLAGLEQLKNLLSGYTTNNNYKNILLKFKQMIEWFDLEDDLENK